MIEERVGADSAIQPWGEHARGGAVTTLSTMANSVLGLAVAVAASAFLPVSAHGQSDADVELIDSSHIEFTVDYTVKGY